MDVTRMKPVTEKQTTIHVNSSYYVASSCVQGWRDHMEDENTVLLQTPVDENCAFFGVYDGHCGSKVAKMARNYLHMNILTQSTYESGDIENAIREGFMSLDMSMKKDGVKGGSTAIVVLIRGSKLYCGNAGDSRAIAFVGGAPIALSVDHKPSLPQELKRITNAGFSVDSNRINGELEISRGLGDFVYKNRKGIPPSLQAVSCVPDVRLEHITAEWIFVLLASDGVFDVLSTKQVGLFVNSRINLGLRPEVIVELLLDRCIKLGKGMVTRGLDNMTVILIIFMNNANERYKEILRDPPAVKYLGSSNSKPKPDTTTQAGTSGT